MSLERDALSRLVEATDMLQAWRMDWGVPHADVDKFWSDSWAYARAALLFGTAPLPRNFLGNCACGHWIGIDHFRGGLPRTWAMVRRTP